MAQSKDIYLRIPTFHDTEAAYTLPNDEVEHTRLLEQHNSVVALVKERMVHAPVTAPSIVLDIGCGTGVVTRYLGSHFPTAQHVYGIDLSAVPAQPGDESASHLSFIRGDFRTLAGADPRLRFGSADFVFSRMLLCGMTDWPGYVRDVLKMLKPGCWAEMGDYVEDCFYSDKDNNKSTPREDWEWLRSLRAGGARLGFDMDCGLNIRRYMEEAGFVDIQRWEYRIPYWRGAGEECPETRKMTEFMIGDKWGLYWHMLPKMISGMGYSEDDMQRLRLEMRRDLGEEEGKYQVYCVTIGRKPSLGEDGRAYPRY